MLLRLERTWLHATCVIGLLTVDGTNECFTLEDPVREIPGEPVSRWKIQNETAIPRGTYDIAMHFSPHFQREVPMLLNVPGYTLVYIHSGNEPKDTDGCILVGRSKTDHCINESRAAFDALFAQIKAALDGGERVQIEVA